MQIEPWYASGHDSGWRVASSLFIPYGWPTAPAVVAHYYLIVSDGVLIRGSNLLSCYCFNEAGN